MKPVLKCLQPWSAATRYCLIPSSRLANSSIQPHFVMVPGRGQWAAETLCRKWDQTQQRGSLVSWGQSCRASSHGWEVLLSEAELLPALSGVRVRADVLAHWVQHTGYNLPIKPGASFGSERQWLGLSGGSIWNAHCHLSALYILLSKYKTSVLAARDRCRNMMYISYQRRNALQLEV